MVLRRDDKDLREQMRVKKERRRARKEGCRSRERWRKRTSATSRQRGEL